MNRKFKVGDKVMFIIHRLDFEVAEVREDPEAKYPYVIEARYSNGKVFKRYEAKEEELTLIPSDYKKNLGDKQ